MHFSLRLSFATVWLWYLFREHQSMGVYDFFFHLNKTITNVDLFKKHSSSRSIMTFGVFFTWGSQKNVIFLIHLAFFWLFQSTCNCLCIMIKHCFSRAKILVHGKKPTHKPVVKGQNEVCCWPYCSMQNALTVSKGYVAFWTTASAQRMHSVWRGLFYSYLVLLFVCVTFSCTWHSC